jgi:tetratricopeptide (TPR) repeat protein
MGADQYEQAIEEFRSMIAENPDFGKAYKSLVEAFIYSDDVSGARDYFERLLSENPQNPYANYGLARVKLMLENYDEAIAHLERSIALDPGFVFAYGHDGGIADAYLAKSDVAWSLMRSSPSRRRTFIWAITGRHSTF